MKSQTYLLELTRVDPDPAKEIHIRREVSIPRSTDPIRAGEIVGWEAQGAFRAIDHFIAKHEPKSRFRVIR